MGQHTWFYKNKVLFQEGQSLYEKEQQHEDGVTYLDELELLQIHNRLDQISRENDAPFHDCFRTSKRNADNTYTDDIIWSKKECDVWLRENVGTVYYTDQERIDKFWEEYPDGCISFG